MSVNYKKPLILIIILLLAFVAGNLSYPDPLNSGIDFLNSRLRSFDFAQDFGGQAKFSLPHFWNIPFRLGLDLQGGTHLVYQADLSGIDSADHKNALDGLRDVVERRVNLFGVSEPVIQIEEQSQRLIVELAGVKDVKEAISMIGQTPFLEFKEQRLDEEFNMILQKQQELQGMTFEEIQNVPDWQIALEDPFVSTQLTGRYLKKAELIFDETTNKPMVSIQFDDEGAKLFEELTTRNIGKLVAIYIDNTLISSPVVQEPIKGGKAQISGSFTVDEAKSLVRNLNSGALPVPITLISQETIGPSLGQESLNKSLKAGMIGFILVIIFMIIFYRLPGILASLALIIYIALNLSFFKLIPITLTLAGIAGFILSMGMAVDANILIFSRIREELKLGKGFLISLEDGFKRAWPSVRDGNFTIILVSLILFSLGTSFVKGFALTLIIGNLIGMFSAIFITNNLLRCFAGTKFEKLNWLWK
ncbi:protein translocase subunit SecD [Candidatus Parcubacteria bacterium]|nr:protein translocase subunit SecD [Patescibacteria group bacterium]MBU4466953.1 protein translocase subunit SecD [Patescibacteria group bacterium]MCG2688516.1 protein translocase subunit SecD [Candidatus Parcubacteria bacterium]